LLYLVSLKMVELEDIVKLVIYKCRESGNPITETLAAYVAQTTMNPTNAKFFLESRLTESEAQELVDKTVEKLALQDYPPLETIKMQIGYDSAFVQQEFMRQHILTTQSHESNKHIDEIVSAETKSGNDFEGITILYKMIFQFLLHKNLQLLNNSTGNTNTKPNTTTNSTIEREVAAALESVLPRAGLRPFVSLTTPEKVAQLCELSNIVIGIRLFNKEIGKGGVGLESFSDIVNHPSRNLIKDIGREVIEIVEVCDNYTTFFNVLDDMREIRPVSDDEILNYKDELTHRRQYLSYVLSLQEDVQISEQNIEGLQSRYLREMNDLKDLIGNKTSIPKDQVYPKFDALSQIYSQLLEEKNLATLRMDLLKNLQSYKEELEITLQEDHVKDAKSIYARKLPEIKEQEQRITNEVESSIIDHEIIRLMPNTTPDFMHIPLDFQGFCLHTIVSKDGLLIPGKPSLGVLKYKDRYCVFSDEDALNSFVGSPDQYLDGVIDQCRLHPELIHLLRMQDEFPEASLATLLQGKDGSHPLFAISAPLMVDHSTETPTHFEEKNIDPTYHWNEWELRKKALQMANIRNRQTSSTQTTNSNFRRDTETQVWPPKSRGTNVGINQSTNTELPKTYTVGLRNRKSTGT